MRIATIRLAYAAALDVVRGSSLAPALTHAEERLLSCESKRVQRLGLAGNSLCQRIVGPRLFTVQRWFRARGQGGLAYLRQASNFSQ